MTRAAVQRGQQLHAGLGVDVPSDPAGRSLLFQALEVEKPQLREVPSGKS